MLIDWFTVAAQVVNFLILVWLLKRFLYRPILDAMAARERRVQETIASADQAKAGAEEARTEWQQKNAALERQEQELLAGAQRLAEEKRARLIEGARAEAEKLRAKWRESLSSEQAAFRKEFIRRAQEEVLGLARQAMRDLAGAQLEEQMARVFVQKIQQLDAGERQRLGLMAASGGTRAVIRSATPLAEPAQAAIQAAVRDLLGGAREVRFETNDALVAGIELSLDGCKLGWTFEDYLGALRKSADRLLDDSAAHEHHA